MSCTPRIQPFPAIVIRISGAPSRAILSQLAAASATRPSPVRRWATGVASSCPATVITSPATAASQVACTPSATASARRPAPCSRAARAVVPKDRNVICEEICASTMPPTDSAASGTAPRWPTIAVLTSR